MSYLATDTFNIYTDIDLRSGFDAMIYGSGDEKSRGRWAVWQSIIKDNNGTSLRSSDTYKVTGEGKDKDRGFATTRNGFLCTERLIRIKSTPLRMRQDELVGEASPESPIKETIYVPSKHHVEYHDNIILISIDETGNVINPVTAELEMTIIRVNEMCSDDGRIEFYQCICEVQK